VYGHYVPFNPKIVKFGLRELDFVFRWDVNTCPEATQKFGFFTMVTTAFFVTGKILLMSKIKI
jgi:hypothetical protein